MDKLKELEKESQELLSSIKSMADKEEPVTETDHLEQEQRDQMLRSAIGRLPEPQKVVFLLRYEEELPLSEIARVCSIPEGTVKSRLFSALTAMREYCKNNENQ